MAPDHSCSRCRNATPPTRCVVSESASRCARCTQLGRPCDVKKFSGEELERVSRARERVDAQLSSAVIAMNAAVSRFQESVEHVTNLQSLAQQSIAKFQRLKTIQSTLSSKEQSLIAQGLRELDEETGSASPLPDFNDFSWEGVLDDPLPSFETPGVSGHNGSDS